MRNRTAFRAMTVGLASLFGATLLAPVAAQAATCSYFSIADVGVTVKGHHCRDANGKYVSVDGYVEDTKADGKSAYYGIYFFKNGTAVSSGSAKIGGKGKRANFYITSSPADTIDEFTNLV
ncbi:hypothetical protein Aph02nite_02020 [Actinoplanes philippinensis]|uniref:Secreted protein n=1 Tax=Actinoplanes philippinensis TaxID=35752 RepID=A0A1I2DGL9_9ACTN|nr:hypothetical protein [Actinoplanes philippinensis]GIE74252.1 hypothetical protein Aph02nite_02020 [Actinoplanes philippinensis]SFE79664.1 hypothetical protein SAMN05421541_103628 [Actinoplanes philippinensis]